MTRDEIRGAVQDHCGTVARPSGTRDLGSGAGLETGLDDLEAVPTIQAREPGRQRSPLRSVALRFEPGGAP